MSNEEAKKMAREWADSRWLEDVNLPVNMTMADGHKAAVRDFLAGFLAGRANPDREKLIAMLESVQYCEAGWDENKVIDEFFPQVKK